LAAVPDGHEPRRAIDSRPEVIAVMLERFAGMHGHANAQAPDRGKISLLERVLGVDRGGYAVGNPRECHAEGVAHRLEHEAVMLLHRGPHERVVPLDGIIHGSMMRFPTLGAALNVCEQESDRARWQRHGQPFFYAVWRGHQPPIP